MKIVLQKLKIKPHAYLMTHYLELTPLGNDSIKIVGKDKNWNNFTFIKNIQVGSDIHDGNGY